jgi:L1 cell adhesion molecule like protein
MLILNFFMLAPRGIPRIQVTFNVDANGILSVNAREESTGKSKNIKIKNEKGRLHKSEIDKMIADAERYREEDERCRIRVSSRNSLESYLFSVRSAIKEFSVDLTKKVPESDLNHLEKLVNEDISWLEVNREQDASIYEEKLKCLQQLILPIMGKIHKNDLNDENSDKNGPKIEEVLN